VATIGFCRRSPHPPHLPRTPRRFSSLHQWALPRSGRRRLPTRILRTRSRCRSEQWRPWKRVPLTLSGVETPRKPPKCCCNATADPRGSSADRSPHRNAAHNLAINSGERLYRVSGRCSRRSTRRQLVARPRSDGFAAAKYDILVATDIAARGIGRIPQFRTSSLRHARYGRRHYTHRIGRTGQGPGDRRGLHAGGACGRRGRT